MSFNIFLDNMCVSKTTTTNFSFLLAIFITRPQHIRRIFLFFSSIIFFKGEKHFDSVNTNCWKKYIERCIRLCWFMSIQYPPMMLDFGPKTDFNPFAVNYEYTVQPAILLYESGPLLLKKEPRL